MAALTVHQVRRRRLVAQQIAGPRHDEVADVVAGLLAAQAQDYPGTLWAIALRTRGGTVGAVEAAVAAGTVVRTWPMRGTLHLLAAADVRWMVGLLAGRAIARTTARWAQLRLTTADADRAADLLSAALSGGRRLTRAQAYKALADGGLDPAGQRGIHLLGRLCHLGLLCQGPPGGAQATFVLLDEWAPAGDPPPDRTEALGRLAERYVRGHGPAGAADLAWWAGLPLSEARAALAAAGDRLERHTVAGAEVFAAPEPAPTQVPRAELLPGFDEYLLGFRDRRAALDPAYAQRIVPGRNGVFRPTVVVGGRVVGCWRRTTRRTATGPATRIELDWFEQVGDRDRAAVEAAADRYAPATGGSVTLAG